MLSQYIVVYDVAHATGMADMEYMFLTLKGRSLRNGVSFTSSVPLYGATDLKAGVMTAAHVQAIMALQSSLPQVRSAVTALQTTVQQHGWQLSAIQAAAYVVTDIKQGVGNATKIFLSLTKHDVRTGEDFPNLGTCQIAPAAASMSPATVAGSSSKFTVLALLDSCFRHLMISRLFSPGSKLRTVDYLLSYQNHLYEISSVYRFLDRLCDRRGGEDIKSQVEQIAYAIPKRL